MTNHHDNVDDLLEKEDALHSVLGCDFSSNDDALILIEDYPWTLWSNDIHGNLPIHLECINQCRSIIISKCIELYPESLAVADREGYLPLHRLLNNASSSIEVAMMMIEKYPAALKHQGNYKADLPLHIECNHQCRSIIISKCIELYPESLAVADKEEYLPLHRLLEKKSSSVEVAIMMIEKYPAALIHKNGRGSLPLHIECNLRCRSSIISKCIELYPEALSMTNMWGNLPLHRLLVNSESSPDIALMMMEKYPDAIKSGFHGDRPIHLECKRQCRWSIISKLVELYPESLTQVDPQGCLPLHNILASYSSRLDDKQLLMLIEKYPAALHHQSSHGDLPLHYECKLRHRSSIISRCIALYPESVNVRNRSGYTPWLIALSDLNVNNLYERCKSLSILLSANPPSFYDPPHDPFVDKLPMYLGPDCNRKLLNLLPSCLSSAAHVQSYHDLNWQPRSSLVHLCLQLCSVENEHKGSQGDKNVDIDPADAVSLTAFFVKKGGAKSLELITKLIKICTYDRSSRDDASGGEDSYAICDGNGLGDHLLRCIIAYL
jgi:ankyrin repeat protein